MSQEIKTGLYRHFKGKQSLVIAVAKHSESEEEFVIYKGLSDGEFHARPINSFLEEVELNGNPVKRFTLEKEIKIDFDLK